MKLYTLFLKTQDHEHHILLHCTYPFSSIKGVPHHLRTQSQAFSGHILSTKQTPLERCGGCLRYHLFGSHRCIKEIHAFSMISLHVHKSQWARGGGDAQESYCWEGSTPRTNRLPFYISFWIEKIPISYTFNRKKVPLLHT